MKVFARLYLISPAFFCLKLLGCSFERAERESEEGKFTIHLAKMQLALMPECERPHKRAASLCFGVTLGWPWRGNQEGASWSLLQG